jgi:hypothetical protein
VTFILCEDCLNGLGVFPDVVSGQAFKPIGIFGSQQHVLDVAVIRVHSKRGDLFALLCGCMVGEFFTDELRKQQRTHRHLRDGPLHGVFNFLINGRWWLASTPARLSQVLPAIFCQVRPSSPSS